MLARWTTDWDCGYETGWWYCIKDTPFSIDNLDKQSRKNIRKAMNNCEVIQIDPAEYSEDLWRVFQEATKRYVNYQISIDRAAFIKQCCERKANQEYWAGFDRDTNRMIGYMICTVYDGWVDFSVSKYSSDFLKTRVSDALNATCLAFYLNDGKRKYVSNGTRSVVHTTNVQQYYQERFGFRKAYCRLEVKYRFPFNFVVKAIYPLRKILPDDGRLHMLKSLLKMEEIVRRQS